MNKLSTFAKAIAGAATAAIAFAVPVVDDGLVASEVLGILGAGLAGFLLVYNVPNRRRPTA